MNKTQKQIDPETLVAMDIYENDHPLRIDLTYGNENHPENIFKVALYKKGAKLWLHRDLAKIVLEAAKIIHDQWNGVLVLKDGLRTVEAQQAMQDTAIVKANPAWCAEGPDRLLSSPGTGGHPRGMAVDVSVEDKNGGAWNMGTPFDYFTTDLQENPASRLYKNFPDAVLQNRKNLEDSFVYAATQMGLEILPLPSEWWDFRFPASYSGQYEALSDSDLPPDMRMTG